MEFDKNEKGFARIEIENNLNKIKKIKYKQIHEMKKYENLNMCLSGDKLGDNWKEIKDEARIELAALKNHICKKLSNVYDSDETETKEVYNLIVFYVAISAKKVLTCEI